MRINENTNVSIEDPSMEPAQQLHFVIGRSLSCVLCMSLETFRKFEIADRVACFGVYSEHYLLSVSCHVQA